MSKDGILRLPSINGSPIAEYRKDGTTVFRRILLPNGKEFIDGGSRWEEVSEADLRYQLILNGPVGKWLMDE